MKLLMISCKKATLLQSKKEENSLSWIESIQLRGHHTICGLCRKFEQQTAFIGLHAKQISSPDLLSAESKEKMQQALQEQP